MNVNIFLKRKFKRLKTCFNKKDKVYCFISSFVILLSLIYNYIVLPQINLEGNSTIIIGYNDKYVEKGYRASFLGNDVTKVVKIKGNVNTKRVGTYKVNYIVEESLFKRKVSRKVIVEDKKKPILKIDDNDIYLCPGDELVPDKVKAVDDYDGDLTDKVKYIIYKDKIIYSVLDSSGNKTEVLKKIFYKDIKKPKLILKGDSNIYLFVGDKYEDSGYEVVDNCDSDILKKVKKSGSVNTKKAGDYIISYTVSDNASNKSQVERKIKVSEKSPDGTIFLTFDDGPNSGTTDVILDILKEMEIKATFFVTNKGPDELVKRIYDEGHTLALHTATHDYQTVYQSVDAYFNDLYSVRDRVEKLTGYQSNIIRFPGGSSNTVSRKYSEGIMTRLTKEVINRGFKYYDWNISSGDADFRNHSSDEIFNNVTRNLRKDRLNMVLMHDIKTYTRDALKDIIIYGKENGYSFDKITMDTEMIKQRVNN